MRFFRPSAANTPRDTAARGCGRPSLAEGRGLPSITVSGLRPRDARFSFFCARSGGGSKAFSLSGWEGLCPVGFARPYSSREKRSPPRGPRGVVRETTPSNANKRRCRAGRVRLCPLPTFSGRFRYTGRVTAAKPPTKSAAVSVLTSSPETPPRSSCPRNPLSVGLTFALSCGRGLTRTARSARLRRLTSFGG